MRELSVEAIRDEIAALRGAVARMPIYHGSGILLHASGSPLTAGEAQSMQKCKLGSVFFADQGEGELEARRWLTTQVVEVRELAAGDLLVDTLLDPAGETIGGPGTVIDEPLILGRLREASGEVTIRKRGLPREEPAAEYLALVSAGAPQAPKPDSDGSVPDDAQPRPVRPLLAPRARIVADVRDDFQRARLLSLCAALGHEGLDRRWLDLCQTGIRKGAPDVLLVDLAEAPAALPRLRKVDSLRSMAVLVTAPEGRRAEVYKAIASGANGSVPLPVGREALLEKLHSTLEAFGRRSSLRPRVIAERRILPREGGHLLCTLQDKFLSQPLPVREATLLDLTDAGLRVEYRRPPWPSAHAYLAHGVHPQHFFFNYAKDNPLGRDVSVTFPSHGGRTLEGHAKFVHLSSSGDFETAGLILGRMKSSVREHMSAIRGGGQPGRPGEPPGPIRPPSTRRSL